MAIKPKILNLGLSTRFKKGHTTWNKGHSSKIKRVCKNCKKEFWVYPSRLKRRNGGRFCSKSCAMYRYKFNITNADKHGIAWFLGVMATDGYVRHNKVMLDIHQQDVDILKSIKKIFKSEHPIKYCHYENKSPMCYLRLPKPFADLCNSYGIHNKKTFTIECPKIEDKYFLSFLCGCIDGDGSIGTIPSGKIRMYLCSASLSFLEGIKCKLKKYNLDDYINSGKRIPPVYRLKWKTEATAKLCDLMYKSKYAGKRKKKIYTTFLKKGVMPSHVQET